ncbi:hypothetical protein KAU33_13465 [Candidatus Dependentiae bacterium]|nr:hypothetical protein [Candidatus Dependentiae bacterium]
MNKFKNKKNIFIFKPKSTIIIFLMLGVLTTLFITGIAMFFFFKAREGSFRIKFDFKILRYFAFLIPILSFIPALFGKNSLVNKAIIIDRTNGLLLIVNPIFTGIINKRIQFVDFSDIIIKKTTVGTNLTEWSVFLKSFHSSNIFLYKHSNLEQANEFARELSVILGRRVISNI